MKLFLIFTGLGSQMPLVLCAQTISFDFRSLFVVPEIGCPWFEDPQKATRSLTIISDLVLGNEGPCP